MFDLYGTLADISTDEQSGAFWQTVAGMLKTGNAEKVKERYAELCREDILPEGGEFDLSKVMQRLTEEFGSERSAAELAKDFREASVRRLGLFGGVIEMLDGLRTRGARLFLLSNAQACFTRYELEKLKLYGKFDGVMLSSEIGWKKPSPRFFKTALEKFALEPEECVYTGNDLRDDVAGARAVGMRSVYIKTEQSGEYPEHIPADMTAENHKELAFLLFRLAEN